LLRLLRGAASKAEDLALQETACDSEGQVLLAQMHAVCTERQGNIHAVVDEKERPCLGGKFSERQPQGVQLLVRLTLAPELDHSDSRLETSLDNRDEPPAKGSDIRDEEDAPAHPISRQE
jgi:hypothetical protein